MDNSTITPAIISLIYEYTLTPSLSQGLTPTRDHAGTPGDNEIVQFEQSTFSTGVLDLSFIEELIPHLDHASGLAAKQPLVDINQSNPQISPFDLPIPVYLISNKLKLLQANHHGLSMLTDEIQLPERADIALKIAQPIKKEILSAVTLAVDSNISRTVNCKTDAGVIRTIFIIPQTTPDTKPDSAKQALVLFLNHESRAAEIAMSLTKTHGLSQSEAEVSAYLVQGYAPEEIAKAKNVSINTVRTQIKKVFTKTGTSRQAQLVSLILNGPAVLMTIFDNQTDKRNCTTPEGSADVVTLSDGRKISYGDFGPKKGSPVILFHHLFGSRNDKPSDETMLDRLDIRLIIPERPGVGESTHQEERTLLGHADDVRQLMDILKIERAHLAGLSAGAPFAAACAAILDNRVIKLGMVASSMPVDELPKGVKLNWAQRALTSVSRHYPSLAIKQLDSRYKKLLSNPEDSLEQLKRNINTPDAILHKDPEIHDIRLRNIRDASTRPSIIYAHELLALSRPWGFRLSELSVPVILWHGKHDDMYPFEHAEAMAPLIPNCETVFDDNWGKFFPLREWESIYKTLIH